MNIIGEINTGVLNFNIGSFGNYCHKPNGAQLRSSGFMLAVLFKDSNNRFFNAKAAPTQIIQNPKAADLSVLYTSCIGVFSQDSR